MFTDGSLATSSNRMSQLLPTFTTHRCTVRQDCLGFAFFKFGVSQFQTVRTIPDDVKIHSKPEHQPSFLVSGAHNVTLETIKRGDDDNVTGSGPKTVLRLYETYGGHATVRLLIPASIGIEKAIITNLLEDDNEDELAFTSAVGEEVEQGYYSHFLKLPFK